MSHGSGGASSAELMRKIFTKHFDGEILGRFEDAAVVDIRHGDGSSVLLSPTLRTEEPSPCPVSASDRIAVSTDTFVVTPLVFPGGDIGKLAVCGTVNDVLMSGALPRYLTCGFILETGLPTELLDNICASLAEAAAEAGIVIIAGDTKVVEGRGEGGGLMINTTGIGVLKTKETKGDVPCVLLSNKTQGTSPFVSHLPSPSGIRPGDAIIVSGNLGDHHAAILSARMGIKNNIKSDCAILTPIVQGLQEAGVVIHAMRDVTRGGLATVLNELAAASGVSIKLEEENIPVSPEVRAFCGIMGLDPLYMGNEGKVALAVAQEDVELALAVIRGVEIGRDAAFIGAATEHRVSQGDGSFGTTPVVLMRTRIGGTVRLDVLYGEGLPRIC